MKLDRLSRGHSPISSDCPSKYPSFSPNFDVIIMAVACREGVLKDVSNPYCHYSLLLIWIPCANVYAIQYVHIQQVLA